MHEMIVKIKCDDENFEKCVCYDLDKLKSCLFTDNHIKKELVEVEEIEKMPDEQCEHVRSFLWF